MFVEFEDHILHCETHGDPAKPALILIHSLGTCASVWEKQVQALSADYFIICPDLRGHGLSEVSRSAVSIQSLADDVHAIVASLNLDSYHVCGISIGGLVAQAFSARHPDRVKTLTLLDSNLVSLNPPMWRERAKKCRKDGLSSIAEGVLSRWMTPGYRQSVEGRALSTMLARTPDEGYAAACEALADADCRAHARVLRMPMTVALGEFDEATPRAASETLAAALGGLEVKTIPGAAHIPLFEAAPQVNALLAAALVNS